MFALDLSPIFHDLPDKDNPLLQNNSLSRHNALPANCASTLLMCYFFADSLGSGRIDLAFDGIMEKIGHLTSLASRVAVSTDGFTISTDSFGIPVSSAGMVSGFQSVCRQHHNMIAEALGNEWYQMNESGSLTFIWSRDGELPLRDLVVFVMCVKRSRRKRRCKPFGPRTTNFLNALTGAVLKCLAEVVHAFTWQNLNRFTNKDIPNRTSIKWPAKNDSIGVVC